MNLSIDWLLELADNYERFVLDRPGLSGKWVAIAGADERMSLECSDTKRP